MGEGEKGDGGNGGGKERPLSGWDKGGEHARPKCGWKAGWKHCTLGTLYFHGSAGEGERINQVGKQQAAKNDCAHVNIAHKKRASDLRQSADDAYEGRFECYSALYNAITGHAPDGTAVVAGGGPAREGQRARTGHSLVGSGFQ